MAYCAKTDLENAISAATLIQLADDNADGVADTAVLTEAIAEADAEIDSYLSARYTVPFTTVPAMVKLASVDLSLWNLYSRRGLLDEVRRKRYEDKVALLKAIAKGDVTIGVDPEPSGGEQEIQTSRDKDDLIFTRGRSSTGETGSLDNY